MIPPFEAWTGSLKVSGCGFYRCQGEAVRLARQLPTNLPREDVEETLQRMERHLGEKKCIHGRPFLEHLADVPSSEEDAAAMQRPLEL